MSWVPLPWWTSKSTIRTFFQGVRAWRYRAATATWLKMQNPIARSRVAWCPGGRTAQNAWRARPAAISSTATSSAPTACRATSKVRAVT